MCFTFFVGLAMPTYNRKYEVCASYNISSSWLGVCHVQRVLEIICYPLNRGGLRLCVSSVVSTCLRSVLDGDDVKNHATTRIPL